MQGGDAHNNDDHNTLEARLRSHTWIKRKEAYDQLKYLFEELDSPKQTFNIDGKSYTVSRLIPYFEDLTDEEHPSVLLTALDCV